MKPKEPFNYPLDPKRIFVKRLVAFGGEVLEIKDGHIYINGELCDEPRIKGRYYYSLGLPK